MRLTEFAQIPVLEAMNYSERRCETCSHFVPCDMSGSNDALPQHCALNPASILTSVSPKGVCDHHEEA